MAGTDFSHLTNDELIKGIKSLDLPDYIRSKAYGVDVRETLAQMTEMTIQLGVNMGLSPDEALKWARKLQESVSQSEFDSWVATLLDGGPSIFMNTLSELQSTYPNGASGVALVRETDPSKIYVWNGTAWEDFGDYQGIEIKDGSVTTAKLVDNSVAREKIKDGAVNNEKITSGAVTGDKISTRTITGENIALQGIERENIKDNAIGNTQIVDRAVTGNKILDGTIVSDKLADNAITRSKVSNGSITYDKTNFAKLIDEINLFDGNFFNFNLAGNGTFTYIANPSTPHFSTIIELTPGKSYSISTNPDYTGTIKGATASSIVSSGQLNGSFSYSKTTQNGDSRIFTASDNDNYLYIDMYAKGFLKVVESQIPVVSFAGETYPIFESKKEVDNIVWFGDSISCLRKLPDRVENLTGNKVYDVSIAGSTGSTHSGGLAYDGTSFVSLVDAIISNDWTTVNASAALRNHWKNDENISTLKTIDFNTIDKVVLFYGTNDYGGSENSIDTFKNGMKSSIEKLLNQYPHLQFYFVTPLFREDWETFNSQGLTLKPYIDEVVDIAKSYGYPAYNSFENAGINQFNSDYYLNEDGLHQNDIGDKLLGDKLSKFLNSN